jgi:hypothetical protein
MRVGIYNCLEHETILNHLLEPHWGKINTDYYSEHFNIRIDRIPNSGYHTVVISVLGLEYRSWECKHKRNEITIKIYRLIECMEDRLVRYASSDVQFYRYPVFILFQLLTISDIEWSTLVLKYKHCKILVLKDSRTIKLTIGNETSDIAYTDKASIKRLTEDMISGNSPANYYSESAIVHAKSARKI